MDLENKQPRCDYSVEFQFKLRTIARNAFRKISPPMKEGKGRSDKLTNSKYVLVSLDPSTAFDTRSRIVFNALMKRLYSQ